MAPTVTDLLNQARQQAAGQASAREAARAVSAQINPPVPVRPAVSAESEQGSTTTSGM